MATITRGDSAYFRIVLTDPNLTEAFDLAGCTVWGTHKRTVNDPDEDALIVHIATIDGEGVISGEGFSLETDAAAGVLIHRLSPAETSQFPIQKLVFDLQILDTNGDIWTPVSGEDVVVADVTRSTEVEP